MIVWAVTIIMAFALGVIEAKNRLNNATFTECIACGVVGSSVVTLIIAVIEVTVSTI